MAMEEITIKGKSYPIHFGLRTLNRFAMARGEEFSDILTAKNAPASLDSIVELALMGLNDGAERAGSDHRFKENEVWDAFEQEPELMLVVGEMFAESITPLVERLDKYTKNAQRPTSKRRAK